MLLLCTLLLVPSGRAFSKSPSYAEALALALGGHGGRQARAGGGAAEGGAGPGPQRTGGGDRAGHPVSAHEQPRPRRRGVRPARALAPHDPLAAFGAALAALAQKQASAGAFDALPAARCPPRPPWPPTSGSSGAMSPRYTLCSPASPRPSPTRSASRSPPSPPCAAGTRPAARRCSGRCSPGPGWTGWPRTRPRAALRAGAPAEGGAPSLPMAIGFAPTAGGTLSGG
jgi:hypothetical protein